MIKLKWIEDEVPTNVEVRQVYGVVFTKDGRILLKCEEKKGKKIYSLAGGTPEYFDKTREDTLKREFLEEVNTSLKNEVIYLGYQEVDEDDSNLVYAQVRMTAMIDNIGKKQPDPDNGKTYDRILVSSKMAIKLLSWGYIGEKIILKATKIAKEKFGLKIYEGEEIIEI